MAARPPLPVGFRVALDPATLRLTGDLWFGGSPARVLRLTAAGQAAWQRLETGPVTSRAEGILARRMTDEGLAHPLPPEPATTPEITVVVPVRGRPEMLDRCLTGLGGRHPVIVVDDATTDPRVVAAVAARHGATLVRRDVNGGPAAARNTGLRHVTTELVALVDSDCQPVHGWLEQLVAHFADPLVAVAAPRVVAAGDGPCPLDMGDRPARVVARTPVAYVPTAALLARTSALRQMARDGDVFEVALRPGEDVDLVWRLHRAGWLVRYDPSVRVAHEEPGTRAALLARRFHYGTSVAPLAVRHPGTLSHLELQPWPALAVAGLLARRPVLAGAAFTASVLAMLRTLRRAGIPETGTVPAMAEAVRQTWLGTGRYTTRFASPLLAAVLVAPGGRTPARRWGRRLAAASLLLGPALTAWLPRRSSTGPVRFVADSIADDIAYGAGVWAGCLRERTTEPLRPVINRHPLRDERPTR